ncbi:MULTISPECIES: DUF692 family multinuclear iron-containing protein [unclassified Meiothermus]|uniref:multinuclear nonheme iron-dependent oxidase n=1 Tax=unclassified Meiothermus TaxID=370471 RepID=UPI0013148167|nr:MULTISPECIES: DUF692 family multinuclear iron-containing protein [unclassified Meiothermus]
MQLAANALAELLELLKRPVVPLDYLKCPLSPNSRAEVRAARAHRPVLLHGWGPPGYSVSMAQVPEPALLQELALLSDTPYLSAHIGYDPRQDGELSPQGLLLRMRQSVEELRRLTGLEVLLENLPFVPWGKRPRYLSDPEYIREVLEATGAALLLDLAHARVAAYHRGEEIGAYLERMPLEQAVEIHVSGPRLEERGLRDRHQALSGPDYELLEWAVRRTPRLKMLTLEYQGKNSTGGRGGPEVWLEQLERLDALRHRLNHR